MTEAEYRRVWRIRRNLEEGRGREGGRERRNSENEARTIMRSC
jgi:hypothetical protein